MTQKIKHTMGERLNIRFDRKIKLEFHGARLTSDGGLLAYRELDDTLGLFNSASTVMSDKRTGRNIQHDMTNLLRQSVYSRLAGYEDVNDAERLSVDPVMRAVTGKKKNAASANTVGRFETEILPLNKNLESLSEINGSWIERAMERTSYRRIILDAIAIILCFALTSTATVRERCFVQAMFTVQIAGKNCWNQSCNGTKIKK